MFSGELSCKKRELSLKFGFLIGNNLTNARYLTVNYEHSNFSISQRKVQGDPKPDLIAIGPANNKPVTPVAPVPVPSNRPSAQAHLSLGAILGFSIGVALFLILVSGIITFITWKRRSLRLQEVNRRRLSDSSPPKNLPSLASFSTQEIDNNSGFWGYYEVPDTKKAELQDHQTSNNPHLYFRELQIDRLSGDLQYRTQDLLHTEISELMAQSIRSGRVTRMGTTTTKTVTKASVRSVSGASSPRTENFKTDGIESCGLPMSHRCAPCEKTFISSVRCVSLNLNRPLPPTPISVTPRVLSTTIPPERIEI